MKRVEISAPIRLFLFLVAASLVLMLVDQRGWLRFARGSLEQVLIPVEKVAYRIGSWMSFPYESLRYLRTGNAKIADLERQVAQLTVEAVRVKSLEEENESMRKLLGVPFPKQWRFILTNIIGRRELISIDAGEVQGVSVGDAVIWKDVLLGSVSEVSPQMSKVKRLDHSESRVSVYISRSGAEGILVGRFGSQVVLSQVLQGDDIKEDDIVVTTGAFGAPRGLVVGRVSGIISDKTDVYKEAVVEMLMDLNDLQTVFILKESMN